VFGDHPPRWLAWANTSQARAATTVVAMVALVASIILGLRQQAYTTCLGEKEAADSARTLAISRATDIERAADLALLVGPTAPGQTGAELRAAARAARTNTDRVRAENPPPNLHGC
jgi:hypothetical protein